MEDAVTFQDHLPDLPDPPDPPSIALDKDHEVRFWTQRFGVPEHELRDLVSTHGSSPDAIEAACEGLRPAEPRTF